MNEHIRQLHFPQDFTLLRDLFERGYVHPDHPEWDTEGEIRAISDKIETTRRLWPIFRPFFPSLPHMFAGLVWEEAGEPVGAISAMIRAMGTQDYILSSVVVLPAYRGSGIGLALTAAMQRLLASWGAETVLATVISGNTPVLRIAQEHGAVPYTRHHDMILPAGRPYPEVNLPARISVERVRDWDELIGWAQAVTPAEVQRFDPVRAEDFRPAPLVRMGFQLSNTLTGYSDVYYTLRAHGELCGYMYTNLPKEGTSRLTVRIAKPQLAAAVLSEAVTIARRANPDGPVSLGVPVWQPHLFEAACTGGFEARREWVHLGYTF